MEKMKPSNFFLKNVFRNFSFLTLALIQISVDGQVIDKYGQYINENWTGKVTSDRQLQIEYIAENNDLINIRLDSTAFDQYGGIKDGDQRSATGFFRTEKIHGIWWLITPDGYKFLLKGIDELTYKGYANSTDASNTSKFQQ